QRRQQIHPRHPRVPLLPQSTWGPPDVSGLPSQSHLATSIQEPASANSDRRARLFLYRRFRQRRDSDLYRETFARRLRVFQPAQASPYVLGQLSRRRATRAHPLLRDKRSALVLSRHVRAAASRNQTWIFT